MTPDDIRRCADDDARHFELLRALADVVGASDALNKQVHAFAEKYGEADFYTGDMDKALARVEALKP